MRGINKVILVGTLGRDPETKTFPNGGSVTEFSIATSEKWNDKATGEPREVTEWHRIILNNRLGEVAQQYLRKGSKVYIEGSLRTRKYTDKDGVERSITEIRGDNMQMLDSARNAGMPQDGVMPEYGSSRSNQPAKQSAFGESDPFLGGTGVARQTQSNRAPQNQSTYDNNNLDDDLPF